MYTFMIVFLISVFQYECTWGVLWLKYRFSHKCNIPAPFPHPHKDERHYPFSEYLIQLDHISNRNAMLCHPLGRLACKEPNRRYEPPTYCYKENMKCPIYAITRYINRIFKEYLSAILVEE